MRIVIENITKKYLKNIALSSVNFKASNGIYGILGPNGAGKTTLMRIIAGLLKPNSGDIFFDGKSIIKNADSFKYDLGYLPQEFGCFKNLTVNECLNTIAIIKGVTNKKIREEQIEKILHDVNLADNARKKIRALSGGMKRRLGIAQSLLGEPSLIMVDEPTSGLDPEERIKFRGLIRKIAANRVVLISTHIVEDIKSTCDGLALIKKGILSQMDDINSLENYAKNKIWSLIVDPSHYEDFEKKFAILSSNKNAEKIALRLYSDIKPSEDAVCVEPTFEEGYLAWTKK